MANGIIKQYTANDATGTTLKHNGKTGAFLVGIPSGTTATVELSHAVGSEDVVIETLTASGGAQFISPLGTLKLKVTNYSGGGTVTAIVRPLNEH